MPPSRGKQNHLLRRWMFFIEGKLVKLVFIRTLKTMLVIAFFVVCGVIDELTIEGVLKGIFIAVYAHKVGFAVWTVIIFGLIGIYELIKNKKTIRTTLYLLVSSSILILFSMDELIAKNNDINNNPLMKPILAVTVIRDANGLTEKDLNKDLLSRLEEMMKDITVSNLKLQYLQAGYTLNLKNIRLSTKKYYIVIDNKKLAVVNIILRNIRHNAATNSTFIFGITGNDLIRVGCVRGSEHKIPLAPGVCYEEISKSFGVTIRNLKEDK